MMRFLRWLITPAATPLTVAAVFVVGNLAGLIAEAGEPWWYGVVGSAVVGFLWGVVDWTARALLSRRRARS